MAQRLGNNFLSVSEDAAIEGRVVPPAVVERGVRVVDLDVLAPIPDDAASLRARGAMAALTGCWSRRP